MVFRLTFSILIWCWSAEGIESQKQEFSHLSPLCCAYLPINRSSFTHSGLWLLHTIHHRINCAKLARRIASSSLKLFHLLLQGNWIPSLYPLCNSSCCTKACRPLPQLWQCKTSWDNVLLQRVPVHGVPYVINVIIILKTIKVTWGAAERAQDA